jgi:hypothetical protein
VFWTEAAVHESLIRTLAVLVGRMIPPSAPVRQPGADNPRILAEIARSLASADDERATTMAALGRLSELGLADLPPDEADRVIAGWRVDERETTELFVRHTVQCFYRDDDVMAALGMEARPAHPEGYEVEQGDWSLLDPVRERAPMYRDLPDGV